jgi:hypothetical protein
MELPQHALGKRFAERLTQLIEKMFDESCSPGQLLFRQAGWINMDEVLNLFRVSKRTLQTWRTKRLLQHSRIEKMIVYNIYDILDLLERNKVDRLQ